jgi:hypothetical protein
MELIHSSVKAGAKVGYWQTITDGPNGDKVSFILLPLILSGGTGLLVHLSHKKNEETSNFNNEPNGSNTENN